jgi:hypothetical protein
MLEPLLQKRFRSEMIMGWKLRVNVSRDFRQIVFYLF